MRRVWFVLALIGAVLVATALTAADVAHDLDPVKLRQVPAVTEPDPGLYTPFTQAPR